MGELGHSESALAVVRAAFGCGDGLARTITSLARHGDHPRGAQLWPLDGRDETTLLLRGQAHEVAYGREGAMLVLLPLVPGDFYGSMAGSGDSETVVEAVTDGAGAHFGDGAVVRLMESYSCVAVAFARHLSSRLATMRRRMVEAAMLSATGRIAAELLRRAKAGDDQVIRPMPIFSELATTVQSTRETVSRTVSQLEKRGVVKRVDGGLQVVAPHRLEELVY